MLTHLFPFLDAACTRPDLAMRLRRLAEDCERLALGLPVSPRELSKAPLLEDWAPTLSPRGLRLIGYASGHPAFGEGAVLTSPLCLADPDGRWVRTLSRFYILGPSIDQKYIRRWLHAQGAITEMTGAFDEEAAVGEDEV
jgi:hypothetical protein